MTTQVTGYDVIRLGSDEVLDRHDLDLPPVQLHTVAVWYSVPEAVRGAAGVAWRDLPGSLHAAEHAAIGMLPLLALCDRWDIGGLSTALHPDTGRPTVFVYDGYPGGAGLAERSFCGCRSTWRSPASRSRPAGVGTGAPRACNRPSAATATTRRQGRRRPRARPAAGQCPRTDSYDAGQGAGQPVRSMLGEFAGRWGPAGWWGRQLDRRPAMLAIQVGVGLDSDADDVARATEALRRELLDLDVDAVETAPAGPVPPGARAVDAAAIGALLVTVTSSRLFTTVVDAIRTWLGAQPDRTITLQVDGDVLELSGLSAMEQTRLADEWLARHVE